MKIRAKLETCARAPHHGVGMARRNHLILLLAVAICASTTAEKLSRPPLATVRKSPPPLTKPKPSSLLVAGKTKEAATPSPSIYWAVLHNWLYFLSLGFNAINVAFLCREIATGDLKPSPAAIAMSGNVEAVDRLLTFLGVGFLAALSDVHGRKPLMAWSSLGFMITNIVQSKATGPLSLYLADAIDGCSSCMQPVCQAFICDASAPSRRAANLGIFQGLSIGMAFIIAFPVGGVLGAKLGPRVPLRLAAGFQLLNLLIILFVTPESNPKSLRQGRELDFKSANPLGALSKLFGQGKLLSYLAATYALITLARNALDAQFVNYASIRFGWSQQQTGPVMVLVGLMLAIAPRVLVPRIGLRKAISYGTLLFAIGLTGTGLSPVPGGFVFGLFIVSIGCVCIPALQAMLTTLAAPGERGALLGALGTLTELQSAIANKMYAAVLAAFTSETPPIKGLPGAHFFVASALLLCAWATTEKAFELPEAEKAAGAKADTDGLDY